MPFILKLPRFTIQDSVDSANEQVLRMAKYRANLEVMITTHSPVVDMIIGPVLILKE